MTIHPAELRRDPISSSVVMLAVMIFVMMSSVATAEDLTVGLIPEQNVFEQMKRYEPLSDYIRKQTDVIIHFKILPRYGNIIDSFKAESLDGAFWGSFTGGLAIRKLGIQPIVRPLWLNGTSTYHGYVFVRKDSGIQGVPDMKGKTIAFVEKATTAGYIFPLAYFRENGVVDLNVYFKEFYFAGSHDATIAAVLAKKADIGCAKNTIFDLVAARNPRVEQEIRILAESPKVPSNALGMRPDLDPLIAKKLSEAFLSMDGDSAGRKVLAEFGAIRFIPTVKGDYAPVFDLAERAGINLKEYEYRNE